MREFWVVYQYISSGFGYEEYDTETIYSSENKEFAEEYFKKVCSLFHGSISSKSEDYVTYKIFGNYRGDSRGFCLERCNTPNNFEQLEEYFSF